MATHETPMNKNKKLALTSAEANAEANINICSLLCKSTKAA